MLKPGCCGFARGIEEYAKNFNVVEIQQTFYKIPEIKTAERWVSKVSKVAGEFEFTAKASQLITHPPTSRTYRKAGIKLSEENKSKFGFFKNTEEVFSAWEKTKNFCKILNARLILFQCPKSFKDEEKNIENLFDFFKSIKKENFSFAVELRGWGKKSIAKACDELGLIHCVDAFVELPVDKSDIAYLRLHGRYENDRIIYRHNYSMEELEKLKKICRELESKGKEEIYCFFNNTYMFENALEFKKIVL